MNCFKAAVITVLLVLSIAVRAQSENGKAIALYAVVGVPMGDMSDNYEGSYGVGIRYEWATSQHISTHISLSMIGWSEKERMIRQDSFLMLDGGSPMTASIPLELGFRFTIVRNTLVPSLLLDGGIYFSDGSETDVVVPGVGVFIAPGIGMRIPFTGMHAVDARVRTVFGTGSAIDLSYISFDLGVAFTL